MSFIEVEFALFLPLALLLYWLMPRRASLQNGVLILLSAAFYAAWDWRWLPLLWFGAVLDFVLARWIQRDREGQPSRARLWLAISLIWNLGALGYFKYTNFFIDSAQDLLGLFGAEVSFGTLAIILPLGISFYTLQRIGYIVDVYQGRERACESLPNFVLFAGYFPQLTAGPIARASELLHQFQQPRRLLPENIARGSGEFLLGLALKAWVADTLGSLVVNPVFAAPTEFTTGTHWIAAFCYALQVFGDFAGYSLMAIGVSRLFGIELPVNFNFPFLSRSLPELWRRWHITLNRWLFDYIYGPLTTSRGWFRGRLDAALLLTFLASGLWHGAAITFVLWGVMHGIGMVVQRRWDETYRGWCRRDRRFVQWRKTAGYAAVAWLLTQLFFLLSLVPFRAPDGQSLREFATGLVHSSGQRSLSLPTTELGGVLLAVTLVIIYHLTGTERFGKLWTRFLALPAPVRGAAYAVAVAYLIVFVPVGASTFIYRQF